LPKISASAFILIRKLPPQTFLKNIILSLIFIFVSFSAAGLCYGAKINPCIGHETSLLVDTKKHQMWLCQENKPVGEYKVAIGRGGLNKIREGDNKTPLGEYTVGIPRPSPRFGIFIPIGYPTQEQILKGYTGNDIGLHGPYNFLKLLGDIATRSDWTRGCIAVGTYKAISEIARWVQQRNVGKIIIR